ncbi:MAG: hypothetical protein HZC41_00435 [Chloroflexi bacterium]|nr:hypothetical protein [Chloroflexota bacterium]
MRLRLALIVVCLLLTGCSGGAVVFAPTPPPPDLSPLRYEHPGDTFSVMLPRHWSVSAQNTTALAAAAFAPPNSDEPALRFAVINLGEPVTSAALGEFINEYKAKVLTGNTVEVSRQAMGDGSWRLSGLRRGAGGVAQPVNTFIEAAGTLVGVTEVLIPADPAQLQERQRIINTFEINPAAALEPSTVSTLAFATGHVLDFVNVSTWTSPTGAFFITGEVANTGGDWLANVPVTAVLRSTDGLPVAEAADVVLGYGIPPGGFAPFSLRFGQGQPALAASFDLALGGKDWQPEAAGTVYGQDVLNWTDESSINSGGQLVITGTVVNNGDQTARNLRAMVTVFDAEQRVIAAGYGDITPQLAAGESTSFQITLPETGGSAANYILTIQALP